METRTENAPGVDLKAEVARLHYGLKRYLIGKALELELQYRGESVKEFIKLKSENESLDKQIKRLVADNSYLRSYAIKEVIMTEIADFVRHMPLIVVGEEKPIEAYNKIIIGFNSLLDNEFFSSINSRNFPKITQTEADLIRYSGNDFDLKTIKINK